MIVVLKTPENKKIVCNTKTDEKIYGSAQNPPNTGTTYTSGIDMYMHLSRSGQKYFWTLHWSMWQGTEDSFELLTEEQAKEFLLEKMSGGYWTRLEDSELKRAQEIFPDFLEETA